MLSAELSIEAKSKLILITKIFYRLRSDLKHYEGLGELKYENGDWYRGFTKDQKFNGKGRMEYEDKRIYHGDWKDGKWHGQGTIVDTVAGVLYHGQFVNEKYHGKGHQ